MFIRHILILSIVVKISSTNLNDSNLVSLNLSHSNNTNWKIFSESSTPLFSKLQTTTNTYRNLTLTRNLSFKPKNAVVVDVERKNPDSYSFESLWLDSFLFSGLLNQGTQIKSPLTGITYYLGWKNYKGDKSNVICQYKLDSLEKNRKTIYGNKHFHGAEEILYNCGYLEMCCAGLQCCSTRIFERETTTAIDQNIYYVTEKYPEIKEENPSTESDWTVIHSFSILIFIVCLLCLCRCIKTSRSKSSSHSEIPNFNNLISNTEVSRPNPTQTEECLPLNPYYTPPVFTDNSETDVQNRATNFNEEQQEILGAPPPYEIACKS